MEQFKPNSHKSKEAVKTEAVPEKKVEKVVSGPVKTRRKSEFRKFTDVFMPDDVTSVKSYIMFDVLIPNIKKALHDIGSSALDVIFYGETGKSGSSPASRVSYRSYYDSKNSGRTNYSSTVNTRPGYSYDDVVLESRGEAEEVLSRMDDLVATYGMVSIADMYDLVGITGNYTDNKYGWTNIRNAQVVRIRDGYAIKMPKPTPLD